MSFILYTQYSEFPNKFYSNYLANKVIQITHINLRINKITILKNFLQIILSSQAITHTSDSFNQIAAKFFS